MKLMNLISTAQEILNIKQIYLQHMDIGLLKKQSINKVYDDDFDFYVFEQTWGNTSGGFEGIGGSAMTTQTTYVMVPKHFDHDCLVFFGGRFAYKVPYSKKFIEDVASGNVRGKSSYQAYLKQGEDKDD